MNAEPVLAAKPKPSISGIIAILVVLALIIIGAFYAWGERIAENGDLSPEEQEILQELEAQDSATSRAAIEADLDAQTPEEFEAELDETFAEMEAAFEAE